VTSARYIFSTEQPTYVIDERQPEVDVGYDPRPRIAVSVTVYCHNWAAMVSTRKRIKMEKNQVKTLHVCNKR